MSKKFYFTKKTLKLIVEEVIEIINKTFDCDESDIVRSMNMILCYEVKNLLNNYNIIDKNMAGQLVSDILDIPSDVSQFDIIKNYISKCIKSF